MRHPIALIAAAVAAIGGAHLSSAAAAETANHDVYAAGTSWDPNAVAAAFDDQVTWHFDDSSFPHDVWLVPPDGNPDPNGGDTFEVTNGPVEPGGPPVSYRFEEQGRWTFVCKLHSSYADGSGWDGMTGTVDVAAPPDDTASPNTTASLDGARHPDGSYAGPVTVTLAASDAGGSGVASTSYRLDGGPAQVYAGSFGVNAPGAHALAFSSTDRAGNVEPERRIEFEIAAEQTPPTAVTPRAELDRLPRKLTVAKLRRGLRVRGACEGVGAGTAKLTVAKRTARKLDLSRRATKLVKRRLACENGRFGAVLRPRGDAKRALERMRGSAKARLEVRIEGAAGAASDRATLKLLGRKPRLERRGAV